MNCHLFWTWEQLSEEHLTGECSWQVAEGTVEGPGEKADPAGAPLQETCSVQDPGVTRFPLETGVEQSCAWKFLHLHLHVPREAPCPGPTAAAAQFCRSSHPFQLLCTPKRPGLDTELGVKRELGTRLPWCEQWRRHLALPWGTPAFRGWNCVCSRISQAVGRVAVRGTTRKLPAARGPILGRKTPSTSPRSHSSLLRLIHFNWKFLER